MRRAVVASAIMLALLACRPGLLDLGTNYDAADAAPPVADPGDVDAQATTLEERLHTRCHGSEGQRDTYASAGELLSRIVARWYLCTPLEVSPLDADGLEITADAGWHRLVWSDEAHASLVPATTPDAHGTLTCVAFADPDAGAGLDGGPGMDSGTGTMTVPCSDPTPRRGIFVYLEPESGTTHVLSVDLEKDPRRMFAGEVGPSSETAEFVPAD
jgi:hypothetical protein